MLIHNEREILGSCKAAEKSGHQCAGVGWESVSKDVGGRSSFWMATESGAALGVLSDALLSHAFEIQKLKEQTGCRKMPVFKTSSGVGQKTSCLFCSVLKFRGDLLNLTSGGSFR